jgi:hypothetical protein
MMLLRQASVYHKVLEISMRWSGQILPRHVKILHCSPRVMTLLRSYYYFSNNFNCVNVILIIT